LKGLPGANTSLFCGFVGDKGKELFNVDTRSLCTYGRARGCVLGLGAAAVIYNIPR